MFKKITAAIVLGLSVSACSTVETATRNAPFSSNELGATAQQIQRSYALENITFSASTDLSVSERNGYYPFADIVWRGDTIGDRRQQIGEIFQTAANRNTDRLNGGFPVIADIELIRFHGVTERTRYSIGGNYNIVFNMTVRHAETGTVLEPTRRIVGNLSAPGGSAAILADQRGQTEKVRVTDYLTQVIYDEMTGSYSQQGAFNS